MKIVILDGHTTNPGDLSWEPLQKLGNVKVFPRTPHDDLDAIVRNAGNAEAVLTNKVPLNRETIRKIPALRYIGVLATGFNIVNVPAAAKRGVLVTHVPDYCTNSVAEHVFALLLEVMRNVEPHAFAVRKGRWCRAQDFCFWDHPILELAGRTLGIVGYGRTGRAVARRAQAFDMKVLVHTRTPPAAPPDGIEFADLQRVFRESDIVSLHVPLTPATEGMVNADLLRLMKPDAWLVNTSRGGVLDEAALAEALKEKRLGGALLDVLTQEPPEPDHPLLHAPRCLVTPHHAWASQSARTRLIRTAADNLAAFQAGRPVNLVPV